MKKILDNPYYYYYYIQLERILHFTIANEKEKKLNK